jgi:molybdopterin converting factor small subunit
MQQKNSANNTENSTSDSQNTKTSRNKNMAKFIKTALLEVRERTEQQEVQLEEVRTGETYTSLYDALQKQHKTVDAQTLCELFTPLHKNTNYNSLEEALGNKAGLYGRKNEELAEKSFSEILEEIEKGFPEEILELQLRNKK